MNVENYRVFYDDNSSGCAFTISVRDRDRRVVIRADSSSIYPKPEFLDREAFMISLAKRISEAITRGDAK